MRLIRRRRELPVLLHGATGFTGRLVCEALRAREVRFEIAGRPGPRLEALGRALGVAVHRAPAESPGQLEAAMMRARVAISCAGPFILTGRALRSAALEAGTHLLDLSGELADLESALALDSAAQARGVALVSAVGFGVVVAEALAHLAATRLGPLAALELVSAHAGSVPSPGTVRSQLHALQGGGEGRSCYWDQGALREERLAAHRRVCELPAPFGARAAVSVPMPEVAMLPRSLSVRTLRAYQATLAPAALEVAHQGLPKYDRAVLEQTLRALSAGEGAELTAERRAGSRFAFWLRARGEAGGERALSLTGADPYGLTAQLAAECVAQASAPEFERSGVLTPLQAFDRARILATMARAGVRWS